MRINRLSLLSLIVIAAVLPTKIDPRTGPTQPKKQAKPTIPTNTLKKNPLALTQPLQKPQELAVKKTAGAVPSKTSISDPFSDLRDLEKESLMLAPRTVPTTVPAPIKASTTSVSKSTPPSAQDPKRAAQKPTPIKAPAQPSILDKVRGALLTGLGKTEKYTSALLMLTPQKLINASEGKARVLLGNILIKCWGASWGKIRPIFEAVLGYDKFYKTDVFGQPLVDKYGEKVRKEYETDARGKVIINPMTGQPQANWWLTVLDKSDEALQSVLGYAIQQHLKTILKTAENLVVKPFISHFCGIPYEDLSYTNFLALSFRKKFPEKNLFDLKLVYAEVERREQNEKKSVFSSLKEKLGMDSDEDDNSVDYFKQTDEERAAAYAEKRKTEREKTEDEALKVFERKLKILMELDSFYKPVETYLRQQMQKEKDGDHSDTYKDVARDWFAEIRPLLGATKDFLLAPVDVATEMGAMLVNLGMIPVNIAKAPVKWLFPRDAQISPSLQIKFDLLEKKIESYGELFDVLAKKTSSAKVGPFDARRKMVEERDKSGPTVLQYTGDLTSVSEEMLTPKPNEHSTAAHQRQTLKRLLLRAQEQVLEKIYSDNLHGRLSGTTKLPTYEEYLEQVIFPRILIKFLPESWLDKAAEKMNITTGSDAAKRRIVVYKLLKNEASVLKRFGSALQAAKIFTNLLTAVKQLQQAPKLAGNYVKLFDAIDTFIAFYSKALDVVDIKAIPITAKLEYETRRKLAFYEPTYFGSQVRWLGTAASSLTDESDDYIEGIENGYSYEKWKKLKDAAKKAGGSPFKSITPLKRKKDETSKAFENRRAIDRQKRQAINGDDAIINEKIAMLKNKAKEREAFAYETVTGEALPSNGTSDAVNPLAPTKSEESEGLKTFKTMLGQTKSIFESFSEIYRAYGLRAILKGVDEEVRLRNISITELNVKIFARIVKERMIAHVFARGAQKLFDKLLPRLLDNLTADPMMKSLIGDFIEKYMSGVDGSAVYDFVDNSTRGFIFGNKQARAQAESIVAPLKNMATSALGVPQMPEGMGDMMLGGDMAGFAGMMGDNAGSYDDEDEQGDGAAAAGMPGASDNLFEVKIKPFLEINGVPAAKIAELSRQSIDEQIGFLQQYIA